jgi:hypothetical protein
MKTQTRRLRTRFEPETRFNVPAPALPFRAVLETELDRLRAALLRQALEEHRGATAAVALRWAAQDATALAGTTTHPLLVLPELFAEKARAALTRATRQERVYERTRVIMAEAA